MKMLRDGLGGFAGDDGGGEGIGRSLFHVAQAAEVGGEAPLSYRVSAAQYQNLNPGQSAE
jgi:hypothetical protein